MGKRFHLCMSVRGVLHYSDDELSTSGILRSVKHDDGTPVQSCHELRELFMDALAKGYERIPLGECGNFDAKKGCQGHPSEGDE